VECCELDKASYNDDEGKQNLTEKTSDEGLIGWCYMGYDGFGQCPERNSKLCITVGPVTRTAGTLICSWLKVLAINLSWPSG